MKDKKITFMAYTDASSYNNGRWAHPNEPENTCSAGVVTLDNNILFSFHNYNPNTSISYGELFAIHTLLTEFVPLMEGTKCKLILHTDSEYCFKSLTKWYKNWMKASKRGIWYSSGGPIAYQRMMEEILCIIKHNNVQIRHVSGGHFDVLDPKSIYCYNKYGEPILDEDDNKIPKKKYLDAIDVCRQRYYRNNGKSLSCSKAEQYMFYNNICDQIAKLGLEYGMDGSDKNERKRKSFKKFIT